MAALATTNAYVDFGVKNAKGIAVQLSGTFSATVSFQASVDGTNFVPILLTAANTTSAATTATTENIFQGPVYGYEVLRAKATAWTSGTANVVASITR